MASITDKVTDVRNGARPNSARVSSGRSAGGATLACDNLAGWPTASKVHFVTYTIDSKSNPVAGTQMDCVGIVSGNNIGSFTVIDPTVDAGNSVNDVVEMLPTAAWGQDLADALTVGHTRTGAHISSLPLTSPILTTPVITDYTTAGHTHASTAQGGKITSAGITSFDTSLTTISNPYKFRVYRTAALNGGGADTATKITHDTESFDTNSNFATGTYTVPVSGFYMFYARCSVNGANQTIQYFYKNGVVVSRGSQVAGVAATQGVMHNDMIQCTAGDTIENYVSTTTANAFEVGSNLFYFGGFLVSTT